MNEFSLKPNMLLGVCLAPTQADGGDLCHSWNDWYGQGKIKDGSDPAIAAGHWERWKEDILLMHRMGIQTCRFGIEWARVEPREGVFDEEAIAHIKEELMLMIGMGIRPLVCLWQNTNPVWFEEKGGWEKYDNLRCYLIYVERVVKAIGHLVPEYLTMSSPNLYAANGYFFGIWPPAKKSLPTAMAVMSNLASAHIRAYRLIHDVRLALGFRDTKVSFANNLRVFEPKNHLNPAHRLASAEAERLFQTHMTEAMVTGEFHLPLRSGGIVRRGVYCDFYAVNYDSRSSVSGLSNGTAAGCTKNDLGWEIYPEGIVRVCRKLLKLRALPIYLTENGTCDLSDSFRSRYLYDHLKALCESKLPVKRYYYRSFLDGFEWLDGCYARFGLVQTDFCSMEREVKRSGEFYSEIIRHGGVTEEMYEHYVAGVEYHI